MDFINNAKKLVEKKLDLKIPLVWSSPPQESLGHLSLPCFNLEKSAEEIKKKLENIPEIKKIFKELKTAGPYLNFFFVDNIILNSSPVKFPPQKEKVLIEYSNVNTHKEYHIGHLRNLCYGDSVYRLLQATGKKAIPISYLNDFGIHSAKAVWALKKEKKETKNLGAWIGKLYSQGDKESKENPQIKEEITKIMTEIETGQGENYLLWKKSRQWSLNYFSAIYKELGIKFKKTFYESQVIDQAKKELKNLEKKNILKISQGALIADLEKYNLGVLPFVRSDRTALYPVADLELAKIKKETFNPQSSIYVVDVRQSLYLKQLFKVLELAGFKEKLIHLPYEFVSLPSGLMSSRSGNIISYFQARDLAISKAEKEISSRHPEWSKKKMQKVSKDLALATLKFEMSKVSSREEIVFDLEKALKFDGYTATYIEYSYARLQSLKKKAGYKKTKISWKEHDFSSELSLAWKTAQYGQVLERASQKMEPAEIAKYLFELSRIINDYYQKVNIIKSEKNLKAGRLEIIYQAGEVLSQGLKILGIKSLKEM